MKQKESSYSFPASRDIARYGQVREGVGGLRFAARHWSRARPSKPLAVSKGRGSMASLGGMFEAALGYDFGAVRSLLGVAREKVDSMK